MDTIIFKIDKSLKKAVQKRAYKEGFTISDVFNFAARSFARGDSNVEFVTRPQLNAKTRRELLRASKDIKEGKNLSPMFDNAKDAVAYLKRYAKP
jgi:hypothetical protein